MNATHAKLRADLSKAIRRSASYIIREVAAVKIEVADINAAVAELAELYDGEIDVKLDGDGSWDVRGDRTWKLKIRTA